MIKCHQCNRIQYSLQLNYEESWNLKINNNHWRQLTFSSSEVTLVSLNHPQWTSLKSTLWRREKKPRSAFKSHFLCFFMEKRKKKKPETKNRMDGSVQRIFRFLFLISSICLRWFGCLAAWLTDWGQAQASPKQSWLTGGVKWIKTSNSLFNISSTGLD